MLIAVGQPFPIKASFNGDGMVCFRAPEGLHFVIGADDDVTADDIHQFCYGDITIAAVPLGPQGYVWLIALPALERVLEAFYTPHAEASPAPIWNETPQDGKTRALISLELLDRAGIVRAIRLLTISPEITHGVSKMHEAAMSSLYSAPLWMREINAFQRHHATFESLSALIESAALSCIGGQRD